MSCPGDFDARLTSVVSIVPDAEIVLSLPLLEHPAASTNSSIAIRFIVIVFPISSSKMRLYFSPLFGEESPDKKIDHLPSYFGECETGFFQKVTVCKRLDRSKKHICEKLDIDVVAYRTFFFTGRKYRRPKCSDSLLANGIELLPKLRSIAL